MASWKEHGEEPMGPLPVGPERQFRRRGRGGGGVWPGAVLFLVLTASAGTAVAQFGDQQPDTEPTGPLSARVDARADAQLAASLERRYRQIEGLDEIEVEVNAGVVTLSGQVLSLRAQEEAAELARRVEGVARVVDRTEVVLDLRERVLPALDQAKERLQSLLSYLPLLVVSLVIVIAFWLLARLLGSWESLYGRLSQNRFAQDLLRQVVRLVVVLVGLLIALEILDATALVGAVLGTAGIIGLAVGFAFRDLVENYIASVLLSLRQPFEPNDHVVIDSREGQVVRLTSRATILMTLDGNHLRIPNAQVFKGVILNYTRNPKRRFEFAVGVGVGEDLVAAQRLGIEALQGLAGILADPAPMAAIEELGDSSVLVRFFAWVDQRHTDFLKARSEAIRQVKTVLEEAGMDLPEPIYRVRMEEPTQPSAPAKRPGPPVAAAQPAADLAPQVGVDDQIAAELADGEAENLLRPEAPKE